MDRGAWQTTVCGVARVRHELVTKLLWNLSVYSHFLLQATHFSLVKTRGLDWNLTSSKSRIMKCQCTERVYSGTFDLCHLTAHTEKANSCVTQQEAIQNRRNCSEASEDQFLNSFVVKSELREPPVHPHQFPHGETKANLQQPNKLQ